METLWLWPLSLGVLFLAGPAVRRAAERFAFTRHRSPAHTEALDAVSLVRVREPRWRNPQARAHADRELAAAGFAGAGEWVVHEMPELTLALYALPAEHAVAVLYDHRRSGFWAEIVTRYQDGTLASYTTLDAADAEVPEGWVHVAAPGTPLGELWKRMRAERPDRPMRACSRAEAPRDFERAWADSVAYHRRRRAAEAPAEPGEQGRAA